MCYLPKTKCFLIFNDENFDFERLFKLEVLEWLNNGKPKVFRSPAEGNFIVRLMNISLTPNDTLGRMLHSFNCTAYEIQEYSFNNLKELNLSYTKLSAVTFPPDNVINTINLTGSSIKNISIDMIFAFPVLTLPFLPTLYFSSFNRVSGK